MAKITVIYSLADLIDLFELLDLLELLDILKFHLTNLMDITRLFKITNRQIHAISRGTFAPKKNKKSGYL